MSREKSTIIVFTFLAVAFTGLLTVTGSAAEITLIPHPGTGMGDIRSEMVASVTRLHGLKNAFDPDRFISHVLFVNGISGKDNFPKKSWTRSLTRKLKKSGLLKSGQRPKPGDLVVFSLTSGAPKSYRARIQSIGVVEKVYSNRLTFMLAGSKRVIRGTLALGKGKVRETKLISCKGKSSRKGGKGKKTSLKKIPCRASELLIGFADIEKVASALAGPAEETNRIVVFDPENPLQDGNEVPGQL